MTVEFELNGTQVQVEDEAISLLEALRDRLGVVSVKDGCAPQGQCGCCTVLVDGAPRVSCVTPIRRVAGRRITTVDGLDAAVSTRWAEAFCATGGSQCGFCTPGIVMRLEKVRQEERLGDTDAVERALGAHLCRCTGWQTIVEAAQQFGATPEGERDLEAASRRATIEGRSPQRVGPEVVLGAPLFVDDLAPSESFVALRSPTGEYLAEPTSAQARRAAGVVQGRNTTIPPRPPLDVPAGAWAATLRTCWVEPAYLEPDAAISPTPTRDGSAAGNGGAFGAKPAGRLDGVAAELSEQHDTAVRVRWSREDIVRLGFKRPPMAIALAADGSGIAVVARAEGIAAAITNVAPKVEVIEVDLAGPPVSASVRAAGWGEVEVVRAALRYAPGEEVTITSPEGGVATAQWVDGGLSVSVRCGEPLDEVVLRSYCIGAAHMAYSWVTSEAISVDEHGSVCDLTIRSFGILKAADMVPVSVEILGEDAPPCNGSDAVFVAVAAATWIQHGCPESWPTGTKL
jgi:aerobic-type carbon monoxide dehydrogenase small subunit (CoxS/CutS family)